MSDSVPLNWWEHLEVSGDAAFREATTLSIAAALVQDGITGVTVVVPRAPGLVPRARLLARAAGISVRAEQIASAAVTLRFSAQPKHAHRPPARRAAPQASARRWTRFLGRLGVRAPGSTTDVR